MSMNLMDSAEKQFNSALEVKFALSFLFGMILFLRLLLSGMMFLLTHVFNTNLHSVCCSLEYHP